MIHLLAYTLARALAILGGMVLLALILMVCASIAGRALNSVLHGLDTPWADALIDLGVGAVTGDFELVEAGMAFAIFAFLPICQLTGAHATVDVFTNRLPPRMLTALKAVIEIGFAVILILITWRLFEGMESKLRSGQTTFLIQFPVWWPYAGGLIGAGAASLIAVYVAAFRCAEAATGRSYLPEQEA